MALTSAAGRGGRADVVIVGAGCAGLSLAARLADPAHRRALAGRRVVVVDGRTTFPRDRTWCYWDVEPQPFAAAVTRRWQRWRVVTPGGVVERSSTRYAYQHVPSDAFYAEALARLAGARHVTLQLGDPVRAVVDEGAAVRVETAAGTLRAACVVDTRPPGRAHPPNEAACLVQAFAGAVVRTAGPAFDPAAATLMDFTAPWAGPGLGFGYVLPYADDEALVEVAVIAPHAPSRGALEAALARYVGRLVRGRAHEVVLRESGAIPMSAAPVDRRPSPRVVRAGVAGGMAKPSTGYAFLAIQRDAATAAAALVPALSDAAHDLPLAAIAACARPPRSRGAAWLDHVFLRRLAADVDGAPALFARLFAGAAPDALVRFLSDAAAPGDVARVVGALPTLPFAAEAARLTLHTAATALTRGRAPTAPGGGLDVRVQPRPGGPVPSRGAR